MAIIAPVPTTRTSDVLLMQRLLMQLRHDQLQLLSVQTQMSTGRRISTPSEDAPAALRGVTLQRLLERKDQVQVNLNTSRSYLSASDVALSSTSSLITHLRGVALSVADTVSSDLQRQAASQEVLRGIQQLVDVANQQFRGRYLFGGSAAAAPFQVVGTQVRFLGNEVKLQSFADIDLLFATNADGNAVFGAMSPGAEGNVDLNPILTHHTRLKDLRGGRGISVGSFQISDGVSYKTIDIRSAETIGDVVRLIESNPPDGRRVEVRLSNNGLVISIDQAGGGNLTVREVGGGTTAAELGILSPVGTLTQPIYGQDLNPRLIPTTLLRDILGTRPRAVVTSAGSDNDLVFEMQRRGNAYNGVRVQFVDDRLLQAARGLTAGNERVVFSEEAVAARAALTLPGPDNDLILTATSAGRAMNNVAIILTTVDGMGDAATAVFDPLGQPPQLTIQIGKGTTRLETLVDAINATGAFVASPDHSAGEGYDPGGVIPDFGSGLIETTTGNSGGDAGTVFVFIEPGQSSAGDVVAAAARDPALAGVLTVSLDGKDTSAAWRAGRGLIELNAAAVTFGGSGQEFDQESGLRIVNGGETHVVTFHGARTVQDLLNVLNGSGANVRAEINAQGNGINVRSVLSGADFHIGENGGATASQLGIRTFTQSTLLADLNHGSGVHSAPGVDFTILRNDGVALGIDVSAARTVGDVIAAINTHPLNVGAGRVEARLAALGNGIELVNDNPPGAATLTIHRTYTSFAAWDLGLIPRGADEVRASDAPLPAAPAATVVFPEPDHLNNSFRITANEAGPRLNGMQVVFVQDAANGDEAFVSVDVQAGAITIDIDPAATRAHTVVEAINAQGLFSASLNVMDDPTNDGSGRIPLFGPVATLEGGIPHAAAQPAAAQLVFDSPHQVNTAMRLTANRPGTALNGVDVVFEDSLIGDTASAAFDPVARRLLVRIDAGQTTANTVIAAIVAEGTFHAALDRQADPANDGTGVVGASGLVGVTAGGRAETLTGRDVAPLEVKGVFNSLIRLNEALLSNDLAQIQRALQMLDQDMDRANFVRAELGARQQSLDVLEGRLADERIELQRALSLEIDADLVEAITRLTSLQAIFEASLRSIAQTFNMSLLNYI